MVVLPFYPLKILGVLGATLSNDILPGKMRLKWECDQKVGRFKDANAQITSILSPGSSVKQDTIYFREQVAGKPP